MPTIKRVNNYPPEMRELLIAKSGLDHRNSVMSLMADAVATAIRNGQKILLASDSDGTMTPFSDAPLDSRVDPLVVAVLRAYAGVAEEWIITGGDVARTAVVLRESGAPFNALCNYGGEKLTWDDGEPVLLFHPRSAEISPFFEQIADELNGLISPHLNLDPGERAVVDTGEQATARGRVFCERKGIVFAFHPKGQDKAPGIGELVETYLPVAVLNVRRRWAAERVQLAAQGMDIELLEEAMEKTHLAPGNSGNHELAWLDISKYTAMTELVDQYNPSVVAFNGDDTGDIPAIQKLAELRANGTITFFVCVANAPEPEKGRAGPRQELLEVCDVAVLSPRELGEFYADVLRLAAERNPDLDPLVSAAALLAEQSLDRSVDR